MGAGDLDAVGVLVARLEAEAADGRADQGVVVDEHLRKGQVHDRLALETGVGAGACELLAREAQELPGVVLESRVGGVGDLDHRRPHDRAEVHEGSAEEVIAGERDADLVDDGAGGAQRVGEPASVGLDLRLHWEVADRDGQRDARAADVPEVGRDGQRRERDVVERVLTLDHVVEQRDVGDGARHRAVVAVGVEVERRHRRHASVGGLETHDAAEGCRDPDRAADVGARREVRRARGQGGT